MVTPYEKLTASTRTYIVSFNVSFKLPNLFNDITPVELDSVVSKADFLESVKKYDHGSILSCSFKDSYKGIKIRCKKKKSKWFRNAITVCMVIEVHDNNKKVINFKICSNGKLQITGCKIKKQAVSCVIEIQKLMATLSSNSVDRQNPTIFYAIIVPVMKNVDFNFGFPIDREKLSKFIVKQDTFKSILETSFGYTGVNIKLSLTHDIMDLKIDKLYFQEDFKIVIEKITFREYINSLPLKERTAKEIKNRYNTFLCFHTGKCIMSGITSLYMKEAYKEFTDLILKNKRRVIEILK